MQHVNNEPGEPARKLKSLIEAMYDVYAFDPLILINMFHLQSSETLKNLSPELMEEIESLSRQSIEAISSVFEEGIAKGVFVDHHPTALADIFWALFSGVILWNTSKRIIDDRKDFLAQTLEAAFDIFRRGLMR